MKTRTSLIALIATLAFSNAALASPPSPASQNSADQWSNLVKAPPQGREAFQTRAQAIRSLVEAQKAGDLSNLPPIAGSDGSILYPYGQSWPTVVASPLHVAIIQLAPGDKPGQVVLGQPGEWRITQAMAGNVPILAISPRFAGLHTNLMITATSAGGRPRIYYVNLVSDKSRYVPRVGWYFPGQIEQQWTQSAAEVSQSTVATLPGLNADDLNFRWRISCGGGGWFSSSQCSSIKPTRVFDDGVHTYIQMPRRAASHSGLPTVLATNTAGQPAVINFRVKDGYYILDGVPHQIKLIAGVGSSGRVVVITHERG